MAGKRYNFSSYPINQHLTINVIMIVSCIQIGYPDYLGSQRKRSGGLVGGFDVQRIDVRGIDLPFDFFNRPTFDHVKTAQRTILHDSTDKDQTTAS